MLRYHKKILVVRQAVLVYVLEVVLLNVLDAERLVLVIALILVAVLVVAVVELVVVVHVVGHATARAKVIATQCAQ